ncbi:MAG: hypothetical protein WKG07_46125 [Hymenobacter sp.]
MTPNSALATAAGHHGGPFGGGGRRPADAHVAPWRSWAAGDCAEKRHRISGRPGGRRPGYPRQQGGAGGGHQPGRRRRHVPGVIGTAVTKVGALEVARTGLGEAEAAEAGFVAGAVVSESTTRAGYYPGAAPITTKLVVERGTGRLRRRPDRGRGGGGQAHRRRRPGRLERHDRGGTAGRRPGVRPPYSPVWDPVLAAARRAHENRRGS